MRTQYSTLFNFDEWMGLAKSDPQEFEHKRSRVIENVISEAPTHLQPKLRCLQWRIDMERRKHSNPLAACIQMNRMMWDFVYAENGFLQALKMLSADQKKTNNLRCAKILPFKPTPNL